MAIRPYPTTIAVLASAAVIIAGAPAVGSMTQPAVTAEVLVPARFSDVAYDLTALTDITLQGLVGAFQSGYGGYVHNATDPYWNDFPSAPVNPASVPILQTGLTGVAYYVAAEAADNNPVVNYLFEVTPDAAAYVALMQATGGSGTPAGALIRFAYSIPGLFGKIVVAATADIPVLGGITNAYYNGYGTAGLGIPSVVSYVTHLISGQAVDAVGAQNQAVADDVSAPAKKVALSSAEASVQPKGHVANAKAASDTPDKPTVKSGNKFEPTAKSGHAKAAKDIGAEKADSDSATGARPRKSGVTG
jgi:hypothetical protein